MTGAVTGAQNIVDALARLTVERLDDWCRAAQPGAMCVYGWGWNAITAAPDGVAARVQALATAGLVHPLQGPAEASGHREYRVQRSSRPLPKGFPALVAAPRSGGARV